LHIAVTAPAAQLRNYSKELRPAEWGCLAILRSSNSADLCVATGQKSRSALITVADKCLLCGNDQIAAWSRNDAKCTAGQVALNPVGRGEASFDNP